MTTADCPSSADPLAVGMLHLGSPRHGIRRYGRLIADELRRLPGVSVIEHDASLNHGGYASVRTALRAARSLAATDVTVVPYCRNGLWTPGSLRLVQLLLVHGRLRGRSVAVLHDVYSPGGRRHSEWWSVALNTALPRAVVLHGEHERVALTGLPRAGRATVIPHFIEERPRLSRDEARRRLGLDPAERILGFIGWIHPRKNAELAIQSLALLAADIRLWLVGAPSGRDRTYLESLLGLAEELGVRHRVVITGYVSEEELALRLAAIDVGLCPYRDASASGSMSTLLSARRAVVASEFALAHELQRLAPESVRLVRGPEPTEFARTIEAALADPPSEHAFDVVLAERSPRATAARYERVLRRVARS